MRAPASASVPALLCTARTTSQRPRARGSSLLEEQAHAGEAALGLVQLGYVDGARVEAGLLEQVLCFRTTRGNEQIAGARENIGAAGLTLRHVQHPLRSKRTRINPFGVGEDCV